MFKFHIKGFAILVLFALPNGLNAQANNHKNIYLVCERPSGGSTYLPGGLITAENAGTVADAFSGVLNLTLTSEPTSKLIEATWIREAGVVSTNDPAEGGKIRNGFSDSEVKRFDIDWRKGSSTTILVKGVGAEELVVAYADIKAGFGLDKLSSFIALCTQFSSKIDADFEVQRALERIKIFEAAIESSINDAAGAATDAAAATTDVEPTNTDKAPKARTGVQVIAPKRKRR